MYICKRHYYNISKKKKSIRFRPSLFSVQINVWELPSVHSTGTRGEEEEARMWELNK